MAGSGHKNMPNRLESTIGEESLLGRSSTIDEGGTMTGRIMKKRMGSISPNKFETPVKKAKNMQNNSIMVNFKYFFSRKF